MLILLLQGYLDENRTCTQVISGEILIGQIKTKACNYSMEGKDRAGSVREGQMDTKEEEKMEDGGRRT